MENVYIPATFVGKPLTNTSVRTRWQMTIPLVILQGTLVDAVTQVVRVQTDVVAVTAVVTRTGKVLYVFVVQMWEGTVVHTVIDQETRYTEIVVTTKVSLRTHIPLDYLRQLSQAVPVKVQSDW